MENNKRCPKCQFTKDKLTGFAKNQGHCRDCHKAYRQANKERIYLLNKHYQEDNRDKVRAWSRKFYAKHVKEETVRNREKYQRDKEKLKPTRAAWVKANPEKCQAYWATRRARKWIAQANSLTAKQWLELLEEHKRTCFYCGATPERLEQEHKIPLSRGGLHTKENVVPACFACNRRKSAKTDQEFFLEISEQHPSAAQTTIEGPPTSELGPLDCISILPE